jgi:drug/metabolite transporter (DMT)-like permease
MHNGIPLILLSMSLTPVGDAMSKALAGSITPVTIVFLRYLAAGLLGLGLARMLSVPVRLPRAAVGGTLVQTALVIGAMTLLIAALGRVPLATAVGGFLVAPIVATLLGVLLLGERLTPARAAGGGVSFAGALLILKPTAVPNAGILLALAGGVMLGGFLVLARRARGGAQHPVAALALQCLLGAAMLAPFVAIPRGALTADLLGPALCLGLVTAATHFLTVAAYRRSEPAALAPFFYFNLIVAIVIGLVWFGEVPDLVTLAGLAGIVLGGLLSLAPARLRHLPAQQR